VAVREPRSRPGWQFQFIPVPGYQSRVEEEARLSWWLRRWFVDEQLAPIAFWLCVLSGYYAFVATAGTFGALDWHTDYYDLLVRGWQDGHLHLSVKPRASLLRKANPFNYRYVGLWLWDASLYKGRYYLYWGPVPGLCLWLFKTVTRYREIVLDQWLGVVFMLIRLYAGAALIVMYARTEVPRLPSWALQLAVLAFAVAYPSPYFLARPLIYEAAVAAGQAFVFCGLLLAYWGTLKAQVRTRCFVLAGICFALALGSRGSLIIVAPILVVVTAFAANRRAGYPWRGLLRDGLALGTPVLLGLLLYATYNKLRFDSFTEFGLKYQLTSPPFMSKRRFILPNVVSYLTTELAWSCKFPFVRVPMERELTHLIAWPDDYDIGDWEHGERTAGILLAIPVCWLWSLWLWRLLRSGVRSSQLPVQLSLSSRELWLLGCSSALLCGLAPASRMWMANARFLQDAAGGLLLGAIGAGFWLLARTHTEAPSISRTLGAGVFAASSLHSIFVGVCLGFTGTLDNFVRENPDLFDYFVRTLSVCR